MGDFGSLLKSFFAVAALAVLVSCAPVVNPEPSVIVDPVKEITLPAAVTQTPLSSTPTSRPTIPPTATVTQTLTATFLPSASPTALGTPNPRYATPPTLMLHRSNRDFDAPKFLSEFIPLVIQAGWRAVTFQEILTDPDLARREAGKLIIFTIDDIGLQAPVDPSILSMIDILKANHMPAVLGVVTAGKLPDLNTAQQLKDLNTQGWEIALHTDTHSNLGDLETWNSYGVRIEVRTCQDKLESVIGYRPTTLILPEGQMVLDQKLLTREKVRWAVGIVRGEIYNIENLVIYTGREGPAGGAELTFQNLIRRFN